MKTYNVITVSTMWTKESLTEKVEQILNEKANEGYEIVTVSFLSNYWKRPVAYITICK